MIKGEMRKRQILETAEVLFTEKGYERTSVQDILNILHLSKGSFYHHFESKELVLKRICEIRADKSAEKYKCESLSDGLKQMNSLLSGMIPFQGEGLSFLKMIIPVLILPEGKSILSGYQEALKNAWLPMTREALERMIVQKTAFTIYPEITSSILLDLVNDLWGQLSTDILQKQNEENDFIFAQMLLSRLEPYRAAMENMISAPYGSLELINLESLLKVIHELHPFNKNGYETSEKIADAYLL